MNMKEKAELLLKLYDAGASAEDAVEQLAFTSQQELTDVMALAELMYSLRSRTEGELN